MRDAGFEHDRRRQAITSRVKPVRLAAFGLLAAESESIVPLIWRVVSLRTGGGQ